MIKLILLFMLGTSLMFGQVYKNQYASKIHLTSDPTSGFEYLIVAPTGLASSYTFTLPPSIGNTGEVLTSLGNGSYTWTNPSLHSATPGGSNTNIQFSSGGNFSGSNNFTWSNSTGKLFLNTSSGNFDINVKNWMMSGLNGKSGALRLHTGHASGYAFNFRPNSAMTTSATFTFPSTYGSAGQFLVTDGAGNLYWTSAAIGGDFDCIGQGTGGGTGNTATSDDSFVGGGSGNSVGGDSENGFIGGGSSNAISDESEGGAIITGTSNQITGESENSVIVAGASNIIKNESQNSSIGAGRFNQIDIDDDDDGESFIGAGEYNYIKSIRCVIPAGYSNTISNNADENIIGSGENNFIQYAKNNGIVTGKNNRITGSGGNSTDYASIAGGENNKILSDYGFIGGGANNQVSNEYSSVAGGEYNYVSGKYSAILGGASNTVSGDYSMAFGYQSQASSNYTVAIGRRAVADNQGAFVFADNTDAELNSSADNRMEMRFSGGYRFFTNTGLTTGMKLDPGANSWAAVSDKNVKSNILNLDYNSILNKISDLIICSWAYKSNDDMSIRNYVPMAQDFYKLFGNDKLGHFGTDKTIVTNHITNIGLASLKGLVNKYENGNKKISELEKEQTEILNKLNELENEILLLQNRVGGGK